MELTEDAKKLIEQEREKIMERQRDTMREVEVYKWAARVFFTLVLGGSILGFFKLQEYLDDRITLGTENLQRLFLARSLIDSNQPQDALPELLEYARLSSSSKIPDNVDAKGDRNIFGDLDKSPPSVRYYFLLTALDTLSGIPSMDPQSASFGRTEWEQLIRNTRFQEEVISNPKSSRDMRFLNRMGLAKIKFAANLQEAQGARRFLEDQIRYAQTMVDVAAPSFALGQLSLISGDTNEAARRFAQANIAVPDWAKSGLY